MNDSRQFDTTLPSPSSAPLRVTSTELIQHLDISPDALLVVDQAGTIVMANEQCAALFGYYREELQQQPLEMLLPGRLRTVHTAHREHFFSAPRTRSMGAGLQLFGLHKDGTEIPVDISLRPVLLKNESLAIAAIRDMSEQRRAERERMQQAEQIRLQAELIDQAHDAIFVRDSVSRVIFWNKGAEELYGWSSQEALGRITDILLKTHFPISRTDINRHLEEDGRWEGELSHTCRNGSVVFVESRQVLLRDEQGQPTAILEINRDSTERRRLEQAQHAQHVETADRLAFFQQIMDALPSGIYLVYGADARLMLANRAAANVWGAEWRTHQPMQEFLATNEIIVFDAQGRQMAHTDFATLRAVQEGESVLHHQDVSALREAEYLKDEFIGVAAHELRNPLAVLKGFAEMLVFQTARRKGPELAAWQREALEEIDHATSRLDKLTEDLLDVTRLQAGRLVLSTNPTDLVDLTRHMVSQRQVTTSQHVFSLDTAHLSLMVDIDRVRIEQVLSNLLSNAVKYTPQGGPIELAIREEVESHSALLSVRDRGIGIPLQHQARIFGRFVRAENARATEITGTGLGLYLSRELVERHGGRLWFESTEGVGSTFFMTLPLHSG